MKYICKVLVIMNPYKEIVKETLPRLINMINLDRTSEKYGFADRQFWAWKTIDFPNGTYQGIAHTLAIAIKLELLEKELGLELIDALIQSIPKIAHKNGAVEEAFPEESSFCVTALVAFDVLSAVYRLQNDLEDSVKKEYLNTIGPLINFISKNDETHAIISNHLATGVAAIVYWNQLTGNHNNRFQTLLNIIYQHQSEEGWFMEYEGADPGYQTLCTYYLSAAQEVLNDNELDTRIQKSIHYLSHFIHPDKTIGGLYGSRNTEVYYPGGITYYANKETTANAIDKYMHPRLKLGEAVVPLSIDRENLIPLVNSYAYAAIHFEEKNVEIALPFQKEINQDFQQAGIYIHSNATYYAIVNYKKGGVIKVFNKYKNVLDTEDGGLFITNGKIKASTQVFNTKVSFVNHTLNAKCYYLEEEYPSYFQFMLIRLFAMTIFKVKFLREAFKQAVVKLLITGKKEVKNVTINRKFHFNENEIIVEEQKNNLSNQWKINHIGKFKSIHMASSGYNTFHNLNTTPSKLVKFSL